MKKRVLPILLALVMVLSLMPTFAMADGGASPTETSVASYTNNSGAIKYYDTVGAAISASNKDGGGTVTLLKNAELKGDDMTSYLDKDTVPGYGYVDYIRSNLTLDLGGFTLETADYTLAINPNITLTIENGTFKNTNTSGVAIMTTKSEYEGPGSIVTIAKNATIVSDDGVETVGHATVNIYGTIDCDNYAIIGKGPKNDITLNGATVTAGEVAVYQENRDGGSNYTITDSVIVSENNWAVYIANNKTSAEADNQGMQTLKISNSKVSGVHGILVSYTNADIEDENTEVNAPGGYAFAVAHNGDNNTAEGAVGTLNIESGTFNGKFEILEPTGDAENEAKLTIFGGKFDTDVDGEYIDANLKYGAWDGEYFTYHETREAALEAAAPNGYVFAVTGTGRVVHTITIDYGNGTANDIWTVIDGETISVPSDPSMPNNDFMGWDINGDGKVDYKTDAIIENINSNLTLTAVWALKQYTVSFDSAGGSAVPAQTVEHGSMAAEPTPPVKANYTFEGWYNGDVKYDFNTAVTSDLTLKAVWALKQYTVSFNTAGGSAVPAQTVEHGSTIQLPTVTKPGYIFMGWKCSDGHTHEANATVTVTGNMTFTAVWANMPDITPGTPDDDDDNEPVVPDFPFTDVYVGQWFYEAVKYVYGEGIMNGMDRYTFEPNGTLTRAMVWTMLARMDGADTEGGATWYSKAQDWAMSLDVSDGTNPMGAITREELVTMLWRYAYACDADMSLGEDTNILSYVDIDKVSDWAVEAFQWACGAGIIEGDDAGALNPTSTCTRAEAAAMFMRLCENVDLSPTVSTLL